MYVPGQKMGSAPECEFALHLFYAGVSEANRLAIQKRLAGTRVDRADKHNANTAAAKNSRSYPRPIHIAPATAGMVIEATWLMDTPMAKVELRSCGVSTIRDKYTERALPRANSISSRI